MTEIKIEKKKSLFLWILLILGIIAALFFLFFRNNEMRNENTDEKTEINDVDKKSTVLENTAVKTYIAFIEDSSTNMNLDHDYTSEAINKLANAVEEKADEIGFDLKNDINEAKKFSVEITDDKMATNHADKIRNAADILSSSLKNMQNDKFPNLNTEANDVKSAAAKINPANLTLDQKDAVKTFFNKSAELLKKMN